MSDLFVHDITPEQVERAREWIKALRSGEFPQAVGALHPADGGFCCLGVACHLTDPSGWTEIPDRRNLVHCGLYFQRGSSTSLTEEVMGLYGIETTDGNFFDADNKSHCLSDLNDNGVSFAEIADIIEAELALVAQPELVTA